MELALQRVPDKPCPDVFADRILQRQVLRVFDDDAMFCLLLGLDFRRRSVKMFGSRQRWLDRIMRSWKCVEPFGAYYKMLLRSQGPIMKQRGPLVSLFV